MSEWKLVPVEPTDAMAAAAIGASLKDPEAINGLPQYKAMLAAAPIPEQAASIEGLKKHTRSDGSFGLNEFYLAADVERLLATQSAKQGAQPSAWISVDERLPAKGDAVLVMSDSWDRPAVLVYDDQPYQRFVDRRAGLWFWYPERMHWMPLPETPAMKSKRAASTDGEARDE